MHNRQLSPKMNKDGSLFQLKPSVWDSDCGVGLFYKGPDGGYKLFPLFCTSLYKYLYNAPPVLSAGLHICTCFKYRLLRKSGSTPKENDVLILGVIYGCKLLRYF